MDNNKIKKHQTNTSDKIVADIIEHKNDNKDKNSLNINNDIAEIKGSKDIDEVKVVAPEVRRILQI